MELAANDSAFDPYHSDCWHCGLEVCTSEVGCCPREDCCPPERHGARNRGHGHAVHAICKHREAMGSKELAEYSLALLKIEGDLQRRMAAKRSAERAKSLGEELVDLIRQALTVNVEASYPLMGEWREDRARNIAAAILGNYDVSRPVIR